jgi:hypothetical protein
MGKGPVRRAYNYNPSTKTKININDFVLDVDGLKLKVIDRDGSTRMVPLSNKNGRVPSLEKCY